MMLSNHFGQSMRCVPQTSMHGPSLRGKDKRFIPETIANMPLPASLCRAVLTLACHCLALRVIGATVSTPINTPRGHA